MPAAPAPMTMTSTSCMVLSVRQDIALSTQERDGFLRIAISLSLLLEHDPSGRSPRACFPKTGIHPGSSPGQAFSGSCSTSLAGRWCDNQRLTLLPVAGVCVSTDALRDVRLHF